MWDNEAYDALILRAAQQGIVLLKNDGLLPLRRGRVAVLGSAEELELGDQGSSAVKPSGRMVNVLEGLRATYEQVDFIRNVAESPVANKVAILSTCMT